MLPSEGSSFLLNYPSLDNSSQACAEAALTDDLDLVTLAVRTSHSTGRSFTSAESVSY